ncbi:MAG: hypothetical protein ABSD92_06930 [Candidatus Bathyarchaeia archaeon]|jgi:O-antigen ligase
MLRKINAVLIVAGAIAIIFAWIDNISIQTELVPTIVNGEVIATSTAIIFTGIFFTLGCSNRLVELQNKKDQPYFILAFLGVSSVFVVSTFLCMMINNFGVALKLSFTGLIFAIGTFMSLIALLIQRLTTQNSDSDNQQ